MARRKNLAVLVAVSFLASLSPAEAKTFGVSGFTEPALRSIVDAVNKAIAGPMAVSNEGMQKAAMEANAAIAEEQERSRLTLAKQQRMAQAIIEQQPAADVCVEQTVAAYQKSVADFSHKTAKKSANEQRARSSSGKVKLGSIFGPKSFGASAPQERPLAVDKIHNEKYCDPSTAPGGKCDKEPKDELKSADVAAEKSLFPRNLTYTQEQEEAVQHFIANVVDAVDAPRKPTKAEYDTLEGKKYEGLRQAYLARMSFAQYALERIAARRAAIPGSNKILKELEASSSSVSGAYIDKRKQNLRSSNGELSELELLDIEVGRRVDNPDWYEAVNTTMGPAALEREQTLMLALMLKLQYLMFRQSELEHALAAQQAAELAKVNLRPRLVQAERAMLQAVAKGK